MLVRHFDQIEIQTGNFLLVIASLFMLAACTPQKITDPESEFQAETRLKIDPQVILATNRGKYELGQPIAYWVINRKPKSIYFQNQSLGLCAYKYDSSTHRWLKVKLGDDPYAPRSVSIYPGTTDAFPGHVIFSGAISDTGMIRLAIVGWDDPNNPEGSKFVAFIDVEITEK